MREITETELSALKWSAIGICVAMLSFTVFLIVTKNAEYNRGEKHVRAYINKNCNDCHYGKSFVKIFDHEFIKSERGKDNSAIIDSIMAVSRLKTY